MSKNNVISFASKKNEHDLDIVVNYLDTLFEYPVLLNALKNLFESAGYFVKLAENCDFMYFVHMYLFTDESKTPVFWDECVNVTVRDVMRFKEEIGLKTKGIIMTNGYVAEDIVEFAKDIDVTIYTRKQLFELIHEMLPELDTYTAYRKTVSEYPDCLDPNCGGKRIDLFTSDYRLYYKCDTCGQIGYKMTVIK